jgi:hypothetical protein
MGSSRRVCEYGQLTLNAPRSSAGLATGTPNDASNAVSAIKLAQRLTI